MNLELPASWIFTGYYGKLFSRALFSVATSAESRDISENAALSKSMSASRFSARAFIYKRSKKSSKLTTYAGPTYCSNRVTGCEQFMMVVINQRLSLAVKFSYFFTSYI